MKRKMLFASALCALYILAGGLAFLVRSQGKTEEPINKVFLKVTDPKGHWTRAAVIEGGMLTITDEKTGVGVGFVPVVRSASTVEVKMVQIVAGNQISKEGEKLEFSLGTPAKPFSGESYSVELLAIAKDLPNASAAAFRKAAFTSVQGENCCVCCNDRRTCANCSVQNGCGCCCTNRDACCDACQK